MVTLGASKLFCHLNPQELEAMGRIAREQTFEAGEEIFKEGDTGDGVFVVKDGMVEISGQVAGEARHVFSRIGPGDFFGELAVLDYKPRSACALATEKSTVYFIPRADLLSLVDNSPAMALGLLREVSNRLREFNRQYVREVVQAERLAVIGRFARSIVHDLKNPLNIIGISAEVVNMAQATPESRHEAGVRIRKQVERIGDLIGEILEFTRGMQQPTVLGPVDYGAFVQQTMEELRPELQVKSVSLEHGSEFPSVRLLFNPKRLRRVFLNLIHNATDEMPEGGRIKVGVRTEAKEVVTEIEDTGPGIAPEIADQLFEAFATFGKTHGTGLGLSICKRILEDHRGWISARNKPGNGAIFSFGLPRPDGY